jgi:hypothetical protein
MVNILIKPDPDRGEYVYWSDELERPIAHGNRAAMVRYITMEWEQRWPGRPQPAGHTAEDRAARADLRGSSATGGFRFGHWHDDEMILEQRGLLAREDLWAAAVFFAAGQDEKVWDMMTPLEEHTEVRRG